jgi:TolA-binding protein
MVGARMKFYKLLLIAGLILIFGTGCVYYNTFYLAKKNFNDAEDKREKTGREDAAGGSSGQYKTAIEKALLIITDHPDSKYVDDALYIIGKSYYHLGDYSKAERKFRELLAAYPESDYVEPSLFYLGKCRLQREEYIPARQAFIQVDSITNNKKWKAEAQHMIGQIEFDEGNFDEAIKYYSSYLEKFAGEGSASEIQFKIGEIYDSLQDYESSKNAFLRVADYKPSDSLYYESQFKAGESYYALGMIDSGYVIFEQLSKNEKYYDFAGQIRLKLAEAQSIRGDYQAAIDEYNKIAEEFQKTDPAARAYYQMGEIYLREFNDLETAKTMYDSSKNAYRRSDVYQSALERSTNISRLSQFREKASAEDIDSAALSLFQMAELYLFELENPDTALVEFQVLIDSFPQSEFAPKAYLAKGYIFKNFKNMPDSAEIAFNTIFEKYPSSDYVEEAAKELDVDLDTMNLDYAGQRYRNAEKMILRDELPDSAKAIMQSIIDEFPSSRYAPKAAYAKAWLTEKHSTPEEWDPTDSTSVPDSTIILAWDSVATVYAGTQYGDSALVRLGKKVTTRPNLPPPKQEDTPLPKDTGEAIASGDTTVHPPIVLGPGEEIPWEQIATLIDTLHVVDGEPVVKGEFTYPPSAYYSKFEGYVGFMVKIDFLGKPVDWHILQPSGIKEIDEAANEALRYTEFDIGQIPPEYIDEWQFYRIRVELPLEVKGRQ